MRAEKIQEWGEASMICLVAALLFVGCWFPISKSRARSLTARATGCSPREIELSDIATTQGDASWTAACNGTMYSCFVVNLDEGIETDSEFASCVPS